MSRQNTKEMWEVGAGAKRKIHGVGDPAVQTANADMKKMDGFVEDGSGHDWDRTQSYQDNSAQNQLLFFQTSISKKDWLSQDVTSGSDSSCLSPCLILLDLSAAADLFV
ncbi:hypothetical protein RRG08_016318 [Elysia crispata]|uniref:Uncharacterized protein n=1 Tax=Elysia crispata TaxID=231223 RepID=A0AAE1AX10_9GAST|nr:hypothetical protein RRG08_016318 [Elysia crispata]